MLYSEYLNKPCCQTCVNPKNTIRRLLKLYTTDLNTQIDRTQRQIKHIEFKLSTENNESQKINLQTALLYWDEMLQQLFGARDFLLSLAPPDPSISENIVIEINIENLQHIHDVYTAMGYFES